MCEPGTGGWRGGGVFWFGGEEQDRRQSGKMDGCSFIGECETM